MIQPNKSSTLAYIVLIFQQVKEKDISIIITNSISEIMHIVPIHDHKMRFIARTNL